MSYQLKNPIIPGYYPDPSIIRVDDDFYLTCSSFEMFPGIPVFHSKDLAHWEQIGNALTEENGFHMERNCGVGGLMAPTIRYNNGTYYIINANFADKGNYICTAQNPIFLCVITGFAGFPSKKLNNSFERAIITA